MEFDSQEHEECLRRSGVHLAIEDAILGHGDKKKSLQSLYMTINDDDPVRAIDMTRFDVGETEIWVKKRRSAMRAGTKKKKVPFSFFVFLFFVPCTFLL